MPAGDDSSFQSRIARCAQNILLLVPFIPPPDKPQPAPVGAHSSGVQELGSRGVGSHRAKLRSFLSQRQAKPRRQVMGSLGRVDGDLKLASAAVC